MYPELQAHLYAGIGEKSELISYMELLAWSFIQNKDYVQALRQYKAIDAQLQENGNRVYNLSHVAMQDGDYKLPLMDLLSLKNKGNGETFYLDAVRQTLICKRKLVVERIITIKEIWWVWNLNMNSLGKIMELVVWLPNSLLSTQNSEARYLRNVEKRSVF